jgi:hypothetical protein
MFGFEYCDRITLTFDTFGNHLKVDMNKNLGLAFEGFMFRSRSREYPVPWRVASFSSGGIKSWRRRQQGRGRGGGDKRHLQSPPSSFQCHHQPMNEREVGFERMSISTALVLVPGSDHGLALEG